MATTTEHAPVANGFFHRVGDAVWAFLRRIPEYTEGAKAARHAGYLATLSDDELAKLGLKREAIVAHAFRHLTYRG